MGERILKEFVIWKRQAKPIAWMVVMDYDDENRAKKEIESRKKLKPHSEYLLLRKKEFPWMIER